VRLRLDEHNAIQRIDPGASVAGIMRRVALERAAKLGLWKKSTEPKK
jgi:hypothetical protein